MTSRSASDHGNPAGIAVLIPKGTNSKGMGENRNFLSGRATAEESRERLGNIL